MNMSLWIHKLNLVKDLPMVYVNFIMAVILVSNKKKGHIILYCPSHLVLGTTHDVPHCAIFCTLLVLQN
jgi:hypothetical protein